MRSEPFHFKQFSIRQDEVAHKVGTDGVLLGAWVNVGESDRRILDIGTGTGVIALMLAQRTPAGTVIDAVEIAIPDATQARRNVERSPWPERVRVHHTALQNFTPQAPYDLLVTNPPFFVGSLPPPDRRRTAARHTDQLSFADLLESAQRLLAPGGRFALILPRTEGSHFIGMAAAAGLAPLRITRFRTRASKPVERLLMEFSQSPGPPVETDLLLYGEDGDWSPDYKALTAGFYLRS